VSYIQVLLRVEMRVLLAVIASAAAVSGVFCVCALIGSIIKPWDAAVLGFTGTFYVVAAP
jgi:hypothetical protein